MNIRMTEKDRANIKRLASSFNFMLHAKDVTIAELARGIDVSANSIYKISWGITNPSFALMVRICEYLGTELSDLYRIGGNTDEED